MVKPKAPPPGPICGSGMSTPWSRMHWVKSSIACSGSVEAASAVVVDPSAAASSREAMPSLLSPPPQAARSRASAAPTITDRFHMFNRPF